jgi:hypothetical protein
MTDKPTTDKPYTERLGGRYRREKGAGTATLVERTAEQPAPQPALPARAPAEPAAPESAKKPAKRSD